MISKSVDLDSSAHFWISFAGPTVVVTRSIMFGGFADLFNFGNILQPQGPPPPAPNGNSKTPPASHRILASLPLVKVTADDILEVTNKECLICLDEQRIGAWACKLQCGHLFHKQCIHEWLEKHCTCPVCRFELETDDAAYENERKKRMKNRKLRLRLDEINSKSISQLRELSASLNINIAGCIDKTEVIDKLVKSGFIEITEGQPPMEMTEAEFQAKSVSELKYLLLSFGLSDKDLLYKSELRDKLISSGRIILTPVEEPDAVEEEDLRGNAASEEEAGVYAQAPSGSSSSSTRECSTPLGGDGRYHTLLADLRALSLSEVRELCAKYKVSTAGCIDKAELLERLLDSGHMNILPADEQLEARADYGSSSMDVSEDAPAPGGELNAHDDDKVGGHVEDSVADSGPTSPGASNRAKGSNIYDTYVHNDIPSNSSSSTQANTSSSCRSNSGREQAQPEDHRLPLSDALLQDMSVREIKSIMQAFAIDGAGCLEKSDMIARVKASNSVRIVE